MGEALGTVRKNSRDFKLITTISIFIYIVHYLPLAGSNPEFHIKLIHICEKLFGNLALSRLDFLLPENAGQRILQQLCDNMQCGAPSNFS